MTNDQAHPQNIIVIGAGPVGMVTALHLAQMGMRVCVLEQRSQQSWWDAPDDRTYAINAVGMKVLETIDGLPQERTPILTIEVLDRKSLEPLTFSEQENPLGYMVSAFKLKKLLATKVLENPAIEIHFDSTVGKLSKKDGLLECHVRGQSIEAASMVLAADGRHSTIREILALPVTTTTFDQSALVGHLDHEKPHNNKAVELFTEAGPIAFLPVNSHRSAFVLSLKTALAESLLAKAQEAIVPYCNGKYPHFAFTGIVGNVQIFPLRSSICRTRPHLPIILLGDAATALHPVAGQGLNLGLADVNSLLTVIKAHNKSALNVEDITNEYEQVRKISRESMHFFTNSIVHLFSNDSRILSMARRSGMNIVNKVAPLKTFFAHQASGA